MISMFPLSERIFSEENKGESLKRTFNGHGFVATIVVAKGLRVVRT